MAKGATFELIIYRFIKRSKYLLFRISEYLMTRYTKIFSHDYAFIRLADWFDYL